MVKRMNKKAVSPLIATVLLIAFAVALGAIVMNWGRTYIGDTQDFAREGSEGLVTCSSSVDLELKILKSSVDFEGGDEVQEVNLSLENKGGLDLPQFIVKLFDDNSGEGVAILYNQTFKKHRTKKFSFNNENSNDSLMIDDVDNIKNITRITTIPFIEIEGVDDPIGCENRENIAKASDDDINYVDIS